MGSELGLRPDSTSEIVITKMGIWWICWACIWTVVLAAGMVFLILKRNLPVVRVRGIGLSLSAVTLLHLYWISVQLGVVLAPHYPDSFEYWIMGTYLPLGVALFHAANSRFLYIAQKQREQFAERPRSTINSRELRNKEAREKAKIKPIGSLWNRIHALGYSQKVLVYVGIGIGVQMLLIIFMFCLSRKYHSSWGIPGTEVHGTSMERKVQMGRGWEWWPSVLWLFIWAWVTAPYLLWKSRGIRDTQGWRFQTIGCAVAVLHAAPMWLVALYVPAMEKINRFWIPPQWIAISIWIIEIFTVFLPICEVLRHQSLEKETLEAIAQWEAKRDSTHAARSMRSSSTAIESIKTGWRSHNSSLRSASGESVYTMSALEYVLERNPEPLQRFSALKDFSGENIAFLTSVGDWKASLPKENANLSGQVRRELVRERFNRALRIYTEFISSRDSEFQINISSSQLKRLEAVFEDTARALCGDKRRIDPATPFEVPQWEETAVSSDLSTFDSVSGSEKGATSFRTSHSGSDHAQYWGEIPEFYDERVFDDAEKAIKYLVLTNTWPKFVRNRRNSMASFDVLAEEGQNALPVNDTGDKNTFYFVS